MEQFFRKKLVFNNTLLLGSNYDAEHMFRAYALRVASAADLKATKILQVKLA